MKRIPTPVVIAIISLVVVVFAFFDDEFAREPATESDLLFDNLQESLNAIDQITIATSESNFVILKIGNDWVIPDHAGYFANNHKVTKLLIEFSEMTRLDAKTSDPARYISLDVADINEPGSRALRVEFAAGDAGTVAVLLVGKKNSAGGPHVKENFVRIPGESQTWLVGADLHVARTSFEWLNRDIINIPEDRIESIRNFPAGADAIRIVKAGTGERKFTLRDIPAGRKVAAQFKINDYGKILHRLKFEDVVRADDFQHGTEFQFITRDKLIIMGYVGTGELAGFVKFAAAADASASESVGEEAARLMKRLEGFAFRLSEVRMQTLEQRMTDLLKHTN